MYADGLMSFQTALAFTGKIAYEATRRTEIMSSAIENFIPANEINSHLRSDGNGFSVLTCNVD